MVAISGIPTPLLWGGFLTLIALLLWLDLSVFHKRRHVISVKEALLWTFFWIALSLLFNLWILWQFGKTPALEFFTGYLLEKSLSMDNLFVFLLIFSAFSVPREHQHHVLFWGILGAILTRGAFIAAGTAFVKHVDFAFILFGVLLLYAAYRMSFGVDERFDPERSTTVRLARKLVPVAHEQHGGHFFVKENGRRAITVLFVVLLTIELTDIVFAFDSIPAIFSITSDPFIIFTSNIFAILGLRSLYFALAGMQELFHYLKHGLVLILVMVAVKLLLRPWYEVPVLYSLLAIALVLVVAVLTSLLLRHKHRARRAREVADRAARITIAKTR